MIQQISVSLSEARLAVDAVLGSARPNEAPLAIAVVDGDGNMIYQVRQDGASAVDVRNAERKAATWTTGSRPFSTPSACPTTPTNCLRVSRSARPHFSVC